MDRHNHFKTTEFLSLHHRNRICVSKAGYARETFCWLVAYHIASHDTQVLPKNYYHRHAPKIRNYEIPPAHIILLYHLHLYHSSRPPRSQFQLPGALLSSNFSPRGGPFSNRRLAPRYHTLAHQCRYTKSLGNPTKPHRPHAPPQNCPHCLRKRSWGKRPLAHRHTAAPAAPARCRSHSPSAPWRKVAPWSRASEETSSVSPNCPFLHERERVAK